MDPRIVDLKSTPFSGRRRTRQPIAEVRETVGRCSPCRRNERAKTLCEHLPWTTAKGGSKVGAGLGMLETLERHGIRTWPPVREDPVRDRAAAPVWTSASDPQPEIVAPRSELRLLCVEPVPDPEGRQLGNAFVDRHHKMGHRGGSRRRCGWRQGRDRRRRRVGVRRSSRPGRRRTCTWRRSLGAARRYRTMPEGERFAVRVAVRGVEASG